MKSLIIILAFSAATTAAMAQDVTTAPVPALAPEQQASRFFVPYMVDQESHAKLMDYLGNQPAKMAIPLIQALNFMEQKAIEEKTKRDKEGKK